MQFGAFEFAMIFFWAIAAALIIKNQTIFMFVIDREEVLSV
jgi:hypothetical protein